MDDIYITNTSYHLVYRKAMLIHLSFVVTIFKIYLHVIIIILLSTTTTTTTAFNLLYPRQTYAFVIHNNYRFPILLSSSSRSQQYSLWFHHYHHQQSDNDGRLNRNSIFLLNKNSNYDNSSLKAINSKSNNDNNQMEYSDVINTNNNNEYKTKNNVETTTTTSTSTTSTTTTTTTKPLNYSSIVNDWLQRLQQLLTLMNMSQDDTTTTNNNINDVIDKEQMKEIIYQVFVSSLVSTATATDNDNDDTKKLVVPFWRDMIAFTWNIITLEGIQQIYDFCASTTTGTTTCNDNYNKMSNTGTGISSYDWKIDPSKEIQVIRKTNIKNNNINDNDNHKDDNDDIQQIEVWLLFQTNIGIGRAHVRLVQQQQQQQPSQLVQYSNNNINNNVNSNNQHWKAHTFLTTLQSLHDCPWTIAPYNRPTGLQPGIVPNRIYWHEQQQQQQDELSLKQQQATPENTVPYYVVIIGAGQGGLSLGARLQHLQPKSSSSTTKVIPYIIYESGSTSGTSWKKRYPSLHLHDPVYYNHMPYISFPKTWPIFSPRNKICNFMELYPKLLDLNIQYNTIVKRATQNKQTKIWTIDIEQQIQNYNDDDGTITMDIVKSTVQCYHIVFATGNASYPRRPNIEGSYCGLQIHSSQYKGGKYYSSSNDSNNNNSNNNNNNNNKPILRHVIVIGSNNSAFDICQDIWEQLSIKNGGTVETITMIQRTPAMIVSSQSVLQYGLGPLYNEHTTIHHEEADLIATTVPYKLAMERWKHVTKLMQKNDQQMIQDIQKKGYQLDVGPDGAGIFAKSATEGGGFYIDHGCVELIVRGDVTVRYANVQQLDDYNVIIQHINNNGTTIETLPADMIVYATGYDTMERYVEEICGSDIANQVGRIWGLGLGYKPWKDPKPWVGELRNMWKPCTVDGLWFQGGNLAQNRHYSKYLALQLAARYIGIETNVYGIPKPTKR